MRLIVLTGTLLLSARAWFVQPRCFWRLLHHRIKSWKGSRIRFGTQLSPIRLQVMHFSYMIFTYIIICDILSIIGDSVHLICGSANTTSAYCENIQPVIVCNQIRNGLSPGVVRGRSVGAGHSRTTQKDSQSFSFLPTISDCIRIVRTI